MKLGIVVIVLLAVLAGAGAGGWWYMNQAAPNPELAAEVEAAPPKFVKVDPIVLPLIRQGEVTKFITVVVTLEMTLDDAAIRVRGVKRRLMDALFTELHALFSMRMVQDKGADTQIIKDRVKVVANRVLGEGSVRSVLIQGIAQQRPKRG